MKLKKLKGAFYIDAMKAARILRKRGIKTRVTTSCYYEPALNYYRDGSVEMDLKIKEALTEARELGLDFYQSSILEGGK